MSERSRRKIGGRPNRSVFTGDTTTSEQKKKPDIIALHHDLKVLYYENHIFSGPYIYKLVLPEPASSQNEESKRVLHGLCSPTTGKSALLQAVQIQLLSLSNDRRDVHRPASSVRKHFPLPTEISRRGTFIPEVRLGVSCSKIAVFCNVVTQS